MADDLRTHIALELQHWHDVGGDWGREQHLADADWVIGMVDAERAAVARATAARGAVQCETCHGRGWVEPEHAQPVA